jgi:hypothetical protein
MFQGSPPKKTHGIKPLDWLPEELIRSGFRDAFTGFSKEQRGALRDIDGDSPFSQPSLSVTEIRFQVFDEQHWLTGRGYDGRVIPLVS